MRAHRGKISAHIGNAADLEAQKAAIIRKCQPCLRAQIAAMYGGGEFLAGFRLPGDAALKVARGPKRQHIFRKQKILGTKAAAHIGADKMKGIFRQVKYSRKLPANAMHAHAGKDQFKPTAIEMRQRGAWFNRHGMDAIIEEIEADDVVRLRESCICGGAITLQETKRLIPWRLWPDLRCLRAKGVGAINHRGQGGIADLNRLSRIARCHGAACDDQGNRFA